MSAGWLAGWLAGDDITAESGVSPLSVKICLFVQPRLLLYKVGLFPVLPPKGDLIDIESNE